MSEMVERVARAICEARGGDPDVLLSINSAYDDGRPEADVAIPNWRNHAAAARAAIEAMREPSPEMLAAFVPAKDDGPIGTWGGRIKERVWRAMIDAALKESSPSTQT